MHILHHVPVFVNTTVRLYNLPYFTRASWMQSYLTRQNTISYIPLSVQKFANYAELLKLSSTFLSLICPFSTRSVPICQTTNMPLSCILQLLCFPFSQVESIQSPCQATHLHPTCALSIPFQYFIFYNTSASIPYPTSSFYSL